MYLPKIPGIVCFLFSSDMGCQNSYAYSNTPDFLISNGFLSWLMFYKCFSKGVTPMIIKVLRCSVSLVLCSAHASALNNFSTILKFHR